MRMRGILGVAAVCAVVVVSAVYAADAPTADWPGWLGPNRDGKSPDTGLLQEWPQGGPKLAWKATGIGSGYSSATVTGGFVYITGNVKGQLMITALDVDGKQKWQVAHCPAWNGQHAGARGTVTVSGGLLYLLGDAGKLGCYDAKTGAAVWSRELMKEFGGRPGPWAYAESPLVVDDMVIVTPGGAKDCIVALDAKTGKTKWTSAANGGAAQYSSAIYVTWKGVPMIISASHAGIFAVDPKDGHMLWSNNFCAGNVANCPTPAFEDGYVFWANGYGKGGICLQLDVADRKVTAKEAWRTREMDCHHGGYVIKDGYIYGNHAGGWACLDLKTGKRAWFDRGVGKGSLCCADGMLYTYGEGGGRMMLVRATPEKFEGKGTLQVQGRGPSWAHPVVIGGRLYVRYDDTLYCFDVKR